MCLQWKLYYIVSNRPLKIDANKYNYKIEEIKTYLNKSNIYSTINTSLHYICNLVKIFRMFLKVSNRFFTNATHLLLMLPSAAVMCL